jgi:hypothetical protein
MPAVAVIEMGSRTEEAEISTRRHGGTEARRHTEFVSMFDVI